MKKLTTKNWLRRAQKFPPRSGRRILCILQALENEGDWRAFARYDAALISQMLDLADPSKKRGRGRPSKKERDENDLMKMGLMSSATGETRGQTLARMCALKAPFTAAIGFSKSNWMARNIGREWRHWRRLGTKLWKKRRFNSAQICFPLPPGRGLCAPCCRRPNQEAADGKYSRSSLPTRNRFRARA